MWISTATDRKRGVGVADGDNMNVILYRVQRKLRKGRETQESGGGESRSNANILQEAEGRGRLRCASLSKVFTKSELQRFKKARCLAVEMRDILQTSHCEKEQTGEIHRIRTLITGNQFKMDFF